MTIDIVQLTDQDIDQLADQIEEAYEERASFVHTLAPWCELLTCMAKTRKVSEAGVLVGLLFDLEHHGEPDGACARWLMAAYWHNSQVRGLANELRDFFADGKTENGSVGGDA